MKQSALRYFDLISAIAILKLATCEVRTTSTADSIARCKLGNAVTYLQAQADNLQAQADREWSTLYL